MFNRFGKQFGITITATALLVTGWAAVADQALAAAPTAEQALTLQPIQKDVAYDRPSAEDAGKCTVNAETRMGTSGWVVRDGNGQFLRQFLDTNRDNKVDNWCYYKDGVEVYRDIDANFNGKADQYRWLGTAGLRWGLDKDEDGRIDEWKMISAEEVTAEVVAALRDRDANRFNALLLTSSELKSLGFGAEVVADLTKKISAASAGFASLAQRQRVVTGDSSWLHFGGHLPGVLPAGTNGSTKDIIIHDNVTAVVETSGKHAQVAIGTLVQVGDTWRVLDLPEGIVDGQANTNATGMFFNAVLSRPSAVDPKPADGLSEEIQKLITELEAVDRSLQTATSAAQKIALNERRANALEKLASEASTQQDRENWVRQYADTISSAVQAGDYPAGIDRLKTFHETLAKDADNTDAAGYVKYRYMNAWYGKSIQDPDADYAKIQESWLQQLEEFVKDYPKADDSADAILQIALAREFAGNEEDAKKWYGRIVSDFSTSALAKKASGAIRRLDSVGKPLQFRGPTIDGQTVDLSSYRGKVVLIHYWATWCEPCKQELTTLASLQAKYGKQGFSLVGVSLDSDKQQLASYIRTSRLSWPQMFEDGGLDSRLAEELGILTLPAMLLVDKEGKVISRNIHAAELDAELGKILR